MRVPKRNLGLAQTHFPIGRAPDQSSSVAPPVRFPEATVEDGDPRLVFVLQVNDQLFDQRVVYGLRLAVHKAVPTLLSSNG